MQPFRYSPKDITEYFITSLPACEVSSIARYDLVNRTAVWNLFWLSIPDLDALPAHGATPNWHKHYLPTTGAIKAITADAIDDEALLRKLQLHPTRFADFWEREDHSIYDSYDVLGGSSWAELVLVRARLAAQRMATEVPALMSQDNVFAFRRRVA